MYLQYGVVVNLDASDDGKHDENNDDNDCAVDGEDDDDDADDDTCFHCMLEHATYKCTSMLEHACSHVGSKVCML